MTSWNIADVWELAADVKGEATALICGDARRSWTELDRRANGLARTLLDAGLGHQDKVAQYLYNGNEYLESLFACFKASLVPVNTNYRYGEQELYYLWDNADAAAIVFHGAFTGTVGHLRSRLPLLKVLVHVDDGTTPCPDWAIPYESAAARAPRGSKVRRAGAGTTYICSSPVAPPACRRASCGARTISSR